MKKITYLLLILAATTNAFAQQKNTLLQADFWKQNPSLETVKAEIAKGNDPAQLDQRQMDPTSLAINANAPVEVVKYLVDQKGNSVSKGTHHSRTYLHWAASKGNVELVKYLIAKGSDVEKGDSYGVPTVAYAASTGQANPAIYDIFFKTPADAKKKYGNGASLLLLGIAADKDLKLSEYFISKGLSLTDVDADGATAFDYAAKSGHVDLLKTLLAKGVKPTNMALINASQGGRNFAAPLSLYQYFVEDLKLDPLATSKEGNTVLHNVVRKQNQEEVIAYFLAKGADVNKANEDGVTPFMNAVAGRNLALIQLLAEKVKDVNAANKKGETALSIAVAGSSPEVVAFLLSKGANAKAVDKDGNNLAAYLVQSYRPAGTQKDEFAAKVSLLTTKGLDLAAPQKNGNTLYHIAIANLDLGLLQKLEALKINVNAKNGEGSTVLHKAALISKDDKVLKYLLSIGADKSIKTDFDETAFDLAAENKFLSGNNIAVDFLK
jgi:ankyrin repeat protein